MYLKKGDENLIGYIDRKSKLRSIASGLKLSERPLFSCDMISFVYFGVQVLEFQDALLTKLV